jgi:hypothetical protein
MLYFQYYIEYKIKLSNKWVAHRIYIYTNINLVLRFHVIKCSLCDINLNNSVEI